MRALITGASSGIGEALARLLSEKGYSLILTGRNHEKLEAVGRAVKAEQVIVADLKQPESRRQLIAVIRDKVPELVVNNAGFGFYGDALSISVEDQLAIVEVDVKAALEITLEAVRALAAASKKGTILNVSSVAGEHPCPGMSVYGASKSFITQVSRALNTELASKGIHVLAACPGMVATEFARRAAKKDIDLGGGPIMSPEYAAQQIWQQIVQKKEKHIFNWQYRLGSWIATYFAPESWVKRIVWNRIEKRL